MHGRPAAFLQKGYGRLKQRRQQSIIKPVRAGSGGHHQMKKRNLDKNRFLIYYQTKKIDKLWVRELISLSKITTTFF